MSDGKVALFALHARELGVPATIAPAPQLLPGEIYRLHMLPLDDAEVLKMIYLSYVFGETVYPGDTLSRRTAYLRKAPNWPEGVFATFIVRPQG